MKNRLLKLALMLLLVLPLTGCLGPKPVLQSHTEVPPKAGSDDPYRVDAVIANHGPDGGQVEVEVSLTDKKTGETILHDSKEVQLKKDEVQHVLFEMNLPPFAKEMDPKNIGVDIDAHYPIE